MKYIITVLLALLSSVGLAASPRYDTLMVNSNGVVANYTNFFHANAAQIAAEVGTNSGGTNFTIGGAAVYSREDLLATARSMFISTANRQQFNFSGAMTGTKGWHPGDDYPAAMYGDFGYSGGLVNEVSSSTNTLAILAAFCAAQITNTFPDQIAPNGTASSYLGPNVEVQPVVNIAYDHYLQTGHPTAYQTYVANLTNAFTHMRVTNSLVWSVPGETVFYAYDQSGYWDNDIGGYNSIATLSRYDASRKLAEMAAAAGDLTSASNYLWICTNTVVALESTLWDGSGLYLHLSTTNRHDIAASAYAVWLGACSKGVKDAIVAKFVADWGNWTMYASYGGTLKSTDYGNKWFMPFAGWTANVLAQSRPDYADQMMTRLLLKQMLVTNVDDITDVSGMAEFYQGGNPETATAGSLNYMLSAAWAYDYLSRGWTPRLHLGSAAYVNVEDIASGVTLSPTNLATYGTLTLNGNNVMTNGATNVTLQSATIVNGNFVQSGASSNYIGGNVVVTGPGFTNTFDATTGNAVMSGGATYGGSVGGSSVTVTTSFTNSVIRLITTTNATLVLSTNTIVVTTAQGDQTLVGNYNFLFITNFYDDDLTGWVPFKEYVNGSHAILFDVSGDGVLGNRYTMFPVGQEGNFSYLQAHADTQIPQAVWGGSGGSGNYPTAGYIPTNSILYSYTTAVRSSPAPMQSDLTVSMFTNQLVEMRAKFGNDNSAYAAYVWQMLLTLANYNKAACTYGILAGRTLYYPGDPYHDAIYGDYGFMMPGLRWLVNPDDLLAIIGAQAQYQLPNGCLPDAIDTQDSTVKAGGYNEGPLDFLPFVNELYYHWKMTGQPTAFMSYSNNVWAANSYAVTNNWLVYVGSASYTTYYAGDQSGVAASGYETLGTLGYYDAYQKVAAMAAAAGDFNTASNYLSGCSNMVTRLESVLWDAPNGLFLCNSGATNDDVFSSLYAVWLDACRAPIQRTIISKVGKDFGTWQLYNKDGAVQRAVGGSRKFFAWTPYLLNALRQYDKQEEETILRSWMLNQTKGDDYPEGVGASGHKYLMGTALMYDYLTEPPMHSVAADIGITTNQAVGSVTFYITNGVIMSIH